MIFIIARKSPLTILVTVGNSPSHVNLNWLILLQTNLRPYGNQVFFGENGVVTKLYSSYVNAKMAQSILCNFKRRLG